MASSKFSATSVKKMQGGITRAKEHLMAKSGQVSRCLHCPEEVRLELWKYFKDKKTNKNAELEPKIRGDDFEGLGYSDDEDEDDEVEMVSSNAASQKRVLKGPMDLFYSKPDTEISKKKKKEKLRQTSIREACDKEMVAQVHQSIARFWYQASLSFNTIKLKSFGKMVEDIGKFGKGLPIPSYHSIRVPLLKNELKFTENLLVGHKEEWRKYGCSIMSDGWTDRRQRTIINFLVNSPKGTVFVKSIDGSNFVKTGEKLFELLDSLVEEIGEENVVQVLTDNGSNYVAAGKMLMEKRKRLYWTPCAAHCIDLMLEDIGKLPTIKKVVQKAIRLVGFIYSHTSTLTLLRKSTNKIELVRPAVTRFATSFLSLERIHKQKANLRKMFLSDDWAQNKLCKEAKGKEATKTALSPDFWKKIVYALKVMAPLVRVLRLVDGEKKPAMGYIYEAMEKAKETIQKSFKNNEERYKDVFKIIDERWNCQLHRPLHAAGHYLNPEIFYDNPALELDLEVTNGLYECIQRFVPEKDDQSKVLGELIDYKNRDGLFGSNFAELQRKKIAPAVWWKMYGLSTPNLQPLAIKILGLTCSSSGCERNWSVFEQIHSKKRNRLEHQKLHDLVYVKYNQKLLERHNRRDEIDPISLDDIDECNEWLVGEMDHEDDRGNELVFDDDNTLDWDTVYEATGLGEPRTYTRRTSGVTLGGKRKEAPTGASSSRRPKKSTTASTSRPSGRMLVDEDDDEFDVDEVVVEEHEDVGINEVESEGEEEEGYAWMDDNEHDDYVDVNDED